jgi:N-acetylmuramoyl-L-alanine amidase
VSNYVLTIAGALILATGCVTAPRQQAQPLPADWDADLGLQRQASQELTPSPPRPSSPGGTIPSANPSGPSSPSTTAKGAEGMISLSLWAAQNGFGPLRSMPLLPLAAHAVMTAHGKFIVQAGRLAAYWDGLEVRLGFVPQEIGGEIFLHPLDVRKTLEPLSRGLAVATPSDRVIVIDPGHGGSDPGTRSVVDGRHEKEFALDWARRLAPLLSNHGWRVFLTRTADVDVSLSDRVAFAGERKADLYLSLHFNSAGGGREQAGLECYCLTPAGMPSSLTRGQEEDDQVFPNNAFDADNLRYAVRLQQALLQANGNQDRGVRHARFPAVLRGQQCPAVLIEGGYLSNPREARQIADPAHRQRLAEAVARALE